MSCIVDPDSWKLKAVENSRVIREAGNLGSLCVSASLLTLINVTLLSVHFLYPSEAFAN